MYNTWPSFTGGDVGKLEPICKKFLAHCQLKLNPIFAGYKLNNELQGTSTIDQFVTRLKLLAVDCNFEVETKKYADSMIRDRIVFGTSSAKLRSKLIDEGEGLTLEKAIQMGQNYEYAHTQLKSMSGPVPTQEVHAVHNVKLGASAASGSSQKQQKRPNRRQKQNAPPKKKDKCTRCGYDFLSEKSCPAMGKTCSLCSKKNHFAQCCKSKPGRNVSEIQSALSNDDSDFYVETISTNQSSNQAFVFLPWVQNKLLLNLRLTLARKLM